MARKNQKKGKGANSLPEFTTNPFANLPFSGIQESDIDPLPTSKQSKLEPSAIETKSVHKLEDLYIRLSKKGRGGKTVTMISNFNDTPPNRIDRLARELRKVIGTGGTWYQDTIELQGDHRRVASNWLQLQGFTLKGEIG